jgi:N4-gp56 family major capsid protein
MAVTIVGTNDPKTNKLYSKMMLEEVKKTSYFFSREFVGDNSILYLKDELSKNPGDRITYQLATIPVGTGRTYQETLESNEESLTTFTDNLIINQLRHALRIPAPNSMGQKRVGYDHRKTSMSMLAQWAAISIDAWVFNQLAGNTATTINFDGRTYSGGDLEKATGFNPATAPSANRHKIAGGQANDESLTPSDTFTLGLVDACLEEAELAETGAGRIKPIMNGGEEQYVMFISHEQAVDLKRDNSSAVQWLDDIWSPALSGGMIKDNPILTGAVGKYDKVIFHKSSRVPLGVNSGTNVAVANTRRAILCGMGAGCISFGNGGAGESAIQWSEELFDYDEELGIAIRLVGGATKSVFDNEDAGVIVASSYAARHNS